MNVFNEEPIQKFVTRKNDPWPIKLAMKYGAKTEQQATIIVFVISGILLLATTIIYKQLFFSSEKKMDINDLPPEVRYELEKAGVKL